MIKSLITLSVILLGSFAMAQHPQENMKAYPPAAEGMKRLVVYLETKEEEDDYRVELMVGKTVEVDAANRFFFSGTLEEETIEGWGFPKYVVKQIGPMAGTRIGVDPDAPKVKRFVKLGGEPKLLRYNSKLPLVVYVPKDAEVKLKVWVASPQPLTLNEG
ncbi:MAG: ecotin family protein [Planctomycetaceae bacterium]|jgi:ecotin|nr:ecotin family protein [Planctomycetaceae bacterium]